MTTPVTASRGEVLPAVAPPATLVGLLEAILRDAFERTALVDGLAVVGREAEPRSWTWGELAAAAVHLAGEFDAAGFRPGDRVAHVGPHGPDWVLADLACLLAGVVHVPLHADASRAEVVEQLAWLEPRGILVSGPIAAFAPRDAAGRPILDIAAAGLRGTAWRRLVADADEVRAGVTRFAAAIDPDHCCTILLSSGTTGRPHGVMHSQRTLAANAVASSSVFLDDPRDVRLSWLPLSHSLALTGDLGTALVRGGCLNVVRDRTRVLDACAALAPTVILGVPAFFERLERGATSGRIADLAAALGGEVRVCISGGAALRRHTAEFFAARGLPLIDGYGLAEAGPVVALASPRAARVGTVGPPVPGVEVRIDERPATRGQLLVRTPARAIGVIPPRGTPSGPAGIDEWLETGDLAEVDGDGHLRIGGRLGDTLVLATGVKVSAAAIEAALAEDDAVAQVCVVAAGLRRPVAVVVPEPGILRAAIGRMGLAVVSRRQAVRHPRVVAWLARRLARRQAGLPASWRVRDLVIADRPFDVARGETTASLKPRRGVIERSFAGRIGGLAHDSEREREPATEGCAPSRSGSWLGEALWSGGAGGFAAAAGRASEPLAGRIEAVLERSETEIAKLRGSGMLYQPLPGDHLRPPLADAPPPPFGIFSVEAERALAESGLWGLAVPVPHGGAGATMLELVRAITRIASSVPTAAGMLAVHSAIGAVSAVVGFGSEEQRARLLPALAAGAPLSIFGATEPDAGCDLARVATRLDEIDGRLLLSGTKMFITGATHGRLVKVLAVRGGKPVVVLARLPVADTDAFRLRHYALHPLRHAHNAALEFRGLEIDPRDVLDPGGDGDAMRIVWHGLNRGRVTLAAQAAGTLRLLAAQARDHAARRVTWGRPIAARQLVQLRLGRIAAATVACDALAAWAATSIDEDQGGEWEAITAKVLASHCVRDAAIDALGVYGGRAFLVGHPLGDSLHDHFAVTVYEGESDLLGLALFKGLARQHPLAGLRDAAAWRRGAAWLAWRTSTAARGGGADAAILDARLRGHSRRARHGLGRLALAIDRAIRRHGRGLADRQVEVGCLSAAVREAVSVLAVAHHADASGDDALLAPADAWCRLALARAAGRMPGPEALTAAADVTLGDPVR